MQIRMRKTIPSGHCRLWKNHPPDCSRQERGTFFVSICYIPWYKIHNCRCIELGLVLSISRHENGWCLGKWGASHASQGWAGASERDSSLRLGNRSKNLLDHVSCSGRPFGCPVYSLRATWSHTAANAFLAGLKRSLRTLPEQQGPSLWVFK